YEDCPQSLHTFSNATPLEGVAAELVEVGSGTKPKDYEGKDVKGKFVLATGRARLVHEQAVYKYGAAGVITDTITYEMPNVRESLDIPDAHAYQAIWPTAEQQPKTTFGFSISKRQGNALRALLKAEKTVKLKATVDAQLFPGHEEVVTATIQGSTKPEEEIFLIAHLCHPKPSANDNASGAGLLLEIARTIKTLIAKGKIPPPARTIRFFWVPETLGTVAYLSQHPEAQQKLVAGINLDMVGQNQELCRSTLTVHRTPDSLPSYLGDYVYSLLEQSVKEFDSQTDLGPASTFRYATVVFSGGSDHAEFTQADTGVPCIMLLQWPDLYYHTSMDTIDKVSEDMLKRVGWITTVAALTLANADAETAFRLATQTVTATIQGTSKPDQEVFLVAHLCHPKPSANDNASGAGLLLEIARTIKTLIAKGKIPPPARTIRFFWVPETLGTVAYLSNHPEAPQRLVAGINLDMVGQNQELCRSTLTVHRTPDSLPSYLADYVYSLLEQSVKEFDSQTDLGPASTFRYATVVFSSGSDHAEFTQADTGVPCIMLLQWPDLYYHTSMDTIDKVSEDMLKRVGWITTVAVLTLANADAETAFRLATQTVTRGIARIEETSREAAEELFKKKEDPKLKDKPDELAKAMAKTANHYKNKLEHAVWREQEATKSVKKLAENPQLNTILDKHCADMADLGRRETAKLEETLDFIAKTSSITLTAQLEETQADKELKKLVPKRLFKGSLDSGLFQKELGEKE
ncbi:DUF4910 domain-containing protein, partial [Candidatus Bathyarchaeota archaeon]|nr:DUF4910 domain-containing protein [Candidatus Bathyarchaeota archaeon]